MRTALNILIVIGLVAGFQSDVASAQSKPVGISYEVDFSDAISHYIHVTMTFEATEEETDLMMATWTPGSYLVREYAKHIDEFEVTSGRGERTLEFEKTSKNRWKVKTRPGKTVKVQYRLFCKDLSVRTNYVTYNYAVLNGAPTFVTIPQRLDAKHLVTLKLPEHWKKSATSLKASDEKPHKYIAEDYDELVDSPIVVGHLNVYPFKVAGVDHYLVNVNEKGYWDGAAAAIDLKKVVQAHHELWGSVPYDRYYFLNVISNGGGGLEHDNSCLVMTNRWAYRNKSSYRRWLSLCSHEFFHTWNVRRLRPKSLVNYDYESEVYTPSLWVAEGLTSYYQNLLLVRAGLTKQRQFIDGLGRSIRGVQLREGRKVQSLRDSSHDAWIKHYRPEENSRDTTISYYTKGAVAGFLLDAEIRSATNNQRSLDDVLRRLYAEHSMASDNPGFRPSDFRRIASEVAGRDLSAWFETAIDSTDELDFQTAANHFGLQIGSYLPQTTTAEALENEDESEGDEQPWVGVGVPGSPATKAGLADTDEVIAVNGMRVYNLDSHLNQFKVGDAINVMIARDDEIQEIVMVVGSRPQSDDWSVKVFDEATENQKEFLAAWLNQPFERKETVKAEEAVEEATAKTDAVESPTEEPEKNTAEENQTVDKQDK